jgi:hypothetical protein
MFFLKKLFKPVLTKQSWFIGGLGFLYVILQIQNFQWALGHELTYGLVKLSVCVFLFFLILRTGANAWLKLLGCIACFGFVWITYYLDLWTISAKTYLSSHWSAFNQAATTLKSKDNFYFGKGTGTNSNYKRLTNSERQHITGLFNKTAVIEIDVSNGNVLFTFDRFIDNGYGFLYVGNPAPLRLSRPTVIYDLTSHVHLLGSWYYVSFT